MGLRTLPNKRLDTGSAALIAAVTVLRGYGGTFPSQAHMSDQQWCAGTGRRDAHRRVILQADLMCKSQTLSVLSLVRIG